MPVNECSSFCSLGNLTEDVLCYTIAQTHNRRKVTELLKSSILVMHHLLKTIHVRGLEKIGPTPMSRWLKVLLAVWCRRGLRVVLKLNKTLVTASINSLGRAKSKSRLCYWNVSNCDSTKNIYLYIPFVMSLSPGFVVAWKERVPDRYWRMHTKHLPSFC